MPLFTYFTIFSVLFLQVFKEVKPTIKSNIIDLDKAVQISKISSGWQGGFHRVQDTGNIQQEGIMSLSLSGNPWES